jgi:hypothetical protein
LQPQSIAHTTASRSITLGSLTLRAIAIERASIGAMRTFFLLAAIALAPAACSKKASDAPAKQAEQVQQIATVSVDQLDTLVANKECVPVDANG